MAYNNYEKKDHELWHQWNKNPSQENLTALIKQVQPLIKHHVTKMSTGNIPKSALEARATSIVIDALPKFNPDQSKLNTFLTWQLKQLNRYVYKHQNLAKIPESRIVNIGMLNKAESDFEDMYGRKPTIIELADEVKLPVSEVRLLKKELRKDIASDLSMQDMFKNDTFTDDAIYSIWHDSVGQDRQVIEHLYGLNGKPKLSLPEIRDKLNISAARLSQIKKKLGDKILKYRLQVMHRF